jgi:hypothetical protein
MATAKETTTEDDRARWIAILGYTAVIVVVLSFIPQTVQLVQTKQTRCALCAGAQFDYAR